ncbi:MAG: 3-keto-5-aminohexanoate cleavage protein [Gemmatimonadales bacterium]
MIHKPLIINLAPTGMVPTRVQNASLPETPDQIAEDAERCRAAGASIIHLHARESDGSPTYRSDIYREIIAKVRGRAPDVIVCVSTSGRNFKTFEQRSEVLNLDDDVRPEMASLTLGSMNFPQQASVNEPAMIKKLADTMNERGIVPELEVFDLGMIDYAKYLIDRKILREPFYFNLLLGSLGTLAASAFNLAAAVMSLPAGSTWAGAGIGRFQFLMNSIAIPMGGNVRVGLEDNLLWDHETKEQATNLRLVERLARLANAAERKVATPDEARQIIGLKALVPKIGVRAPDPAYVHA